MITGREGGLAWVKSAWTVVGGGSDSRSCDLWIIEEAHASSQGESVWPNCGLPSASLYACHILAASHGEEASGPGMYIAGSVDRFE